MQGVSTLYDFCFAKRRYFFKKVRLWHVALTAGYRVTGVGQHVTMLIQATFRRVSTKQIHGFVFYVNFVVGPIFQDLGLSCSEHNDSFLVVPDILQVKSFLIWFVDFYCSPSLTFFGLVWLFRRISINSELKGKSFLKTSRSFIFIFPFLKIYSRNPCFKIKVTRSLVNLDHF